MHTPRTFVAAAAAILVGATLLTGCSSPGSTPSSSAAASGGTLKVVGQNEPVTMNPVYSSTSDVKSWGPMFDALVGTDRASTAPNQDGLLYGWTRPTDTTWLFKVRSGVTFQDGEKFDAAAAAFTITQEVTDPKAVLGNNFSAVASAAPQGEQLLVTTKVPYPALPSMLAITMAVAPDAYKKVGGDQFGSHPVGSGPFTFESYTRGGSLSMVANKDYWRGAPKLDGVTVSWSADPQARASLVQTGQANLALDLTPASLSTVKTDPNVNVVEKPIDARYFVYFNEKVAPFDNPTLRKAAAYAIDKKAIVGGIFKGGGASVYNSFVGDLFQTAPKFSDQISYDLAKAKKLVASVPGSHAVTLTYASGRSPQDGQIGTAVADMLKKAGFDVTDQPVDFATFVDRRNSGTIQMAGTQIINAFRDPDEEFRPWVLSSSVTKNCVSAPYDALSDEALATPDRTAREKVYAKAEDLLLNQDVCYTPILRYDGVWAMSTSVKGFVAPRFASPDYYTLSLQG